MKTAVWIFSITVLIIVVICVPSALLAPHVVFTHYGVLAHQQSQPPPRPPHNSMSSIASEFWWRRILTSNNSVFISSFAHANVSLKKQMHRNSLHDSTDRLTGNDETNSWIFHLLMILFYAEVPSSVPKFLSSVHDIICTFLGLSDQLDTVTILCCFAFALKALYFWSNMPDVVEVGSFTFES